ncbi:hypothetical protein JYK14_20825 [Siccirubricoccus sp. KC 17139]|uniref:Uncharacterized protein n=1 Tax=Siccirubricoccus soli TaxID=2899147 RepID=A0ABT1D9H8_9PROT|nr:hypothetical protein [Siccirubricoccus soli]MCO6418584.1 hypothetical protein [Siccirubricoccus soli]MCP2684719.1 hypothetical protein [Siccirubricoccus soli]
MRHLIPLAGLMLLPPGPVRSQPLPDRQPGLFRVVNATDQDGMQFYLVRPGEAWGNSRIGHPLAPGAALTLRASPASGCKVNLRLVLADGQEVGARDHDICALPTVTLHRPGLPPPARGRLA